MTELLQYKTHRQQPYVTKPTKSTSHSESRRKISPVSQRIMSIFDRNASVPVQKVVPHVCSYVKSNGLFICTIRGLHTQMSFTHQKIQCTCMPARGSITLLKLTEQQENVKKRKCCVTTVGPKASNVCIDVSGHGQIIKFMSCRPNPCTRMWQA